MSKSVEREIVDSIKEIQHSISNSFYNSARKNFETTTVSNKIRIHNDVQMAQKSMVSDFKRASLIAGEPFPVRKL